MMQMLSARDAYSEVDQGILSVHENMDTRAGKVDFFVIGVFMRFDVDSASFLMIFCAF